MVKNVLVSLFAVFLFALGAGGSFYFSQWQEKQKDAEELAATEGELPADLAATDTATTATVTTEKPSDPLPTPARPATMSAEQIVRYASQYRQQVEQLQKREADLIRQESRLDLAAKDVDQRKMEIDGMLKQIQGYVQQSQTLLGNLQAERQMLQDEKDLRDKEMQQINDSRSLSPEVQQQNLSKSAQYISGMQDKDAAAVIKNWVNDGKMDYALQVLENVSERDASKIMSALGEEDQVLVAEMLVALKDMDRPEPATKKR